MGERRTLDRGLIGADSFEHAKPVLVDINTRTGGTQAIRAFVHAHAPAALCQRASRGEPGKSGADDFRVSLRHGVAML